MKNRSYVVHFESPYRIGFRACRHGELTELRKQFKAEQKKITKIEYLENGYVVDVKTF